MHLPFVADSFKTDIQSTSHTYDSVRLDGGSSSMAGHKEVTLMSCHCDWWQLIDGT